MKTPVQLRKYDNSWFRPGGTSWKRALWFFVGQPLLRSALIPSSSFRVALLRMFGARIGRGVVARALSRTQHIAGIVRRRSRSRMVCLKIRRARERRG